MTEYVSGELGGKIKAIICEWWKLVGEATEPAEYLESATIYELLIFLWVFTCLATTGTLRTGVLCSAVPNSELTTRGPKYLRRSDDQGWRPCRGDP